MIKVKTIVKLAAAFVLATTTMISHAADPNSDVVTVKTIKADWGTDSSNAVYYYQFHGLPATNGTCGYDLYARSGDSNINKLLHEAYVLGAGIKVGITSQGCTISTAIMSKDY